MGTLKGEEEIAAAHHLARRALAAELLAADLARLSRSITILEIERQALRLQLADLLRDERDGDAVD